MPLHDVLAAHRNEVIARWKARIETSSAPQPVSAVELVDHIPSFVDEIVTALRKRAGFTIEAPSPSESGTAAEHGEQRLRLGFSLTGVIEEYGWLRDAIVDTATAHGTPVTYDELQAVFDCTITGIAQAVSQYTRQRDAELMRQANEHFAFVAHELRNPLSSAVTALQLLKAKGQLPTDSRAASALERGLNNISELVNQTLQVARVASGVDLRRQETTLERLFHDAELGALPEAEAKGVSVTISAEPDKILYVDTRLVGSAIGNLLRNAVKYTPPGGGVCMRGRVDTGRAVIEVEDACGGLSPGQVEQAFAPFVRLDTQQGGFGLGLAIAKQAVDAHNGSIRVQNLPGHGCVFVLELPLE